MSSIPSASRTKDIFLAAHAIRDPGERERFLKQACGEDAELLQRVQTLLDADAGAVGFLDAPVVAEPAAGDKVGYFGDYVLIDEIARGSNGVVFRARQVSLDRVVALKMLKDGPLLTNDADVQRLRAEAKAAAALDHPNILPIYEVGAYDGQPYFSMKLITGGTLQFRMAEYQQDVRKAVALLVKIARAVHHAHSQGILHRDLKPGNILIDANGEPHVTDFGLARRIGIDSSLTMTGHVMGTPLYMSPEQARGGAKELTPASDIYSLGTMLYELIEGRLPFQSDDMIDLIQQVAEKQPPPAQSPHRPLAAVAMKCLEKSPSARYATAGELADDLEGWLRGEPARGVKADARRPVRPFPWKPVVAALAVIPLALGVKALWHDQRDVILVTTLRDELDPAGTSGSGISLREALRDAPEHGRIRFAIPGKVDLSEALGTIDITRSVRIEGAETEIHAGPGIDHIFVVLEKARVVLAKLTLSGEAENVRMRGSVCAIENKGALEAEGCRFLNNGGAGSGGAVVSQGELTLRHCVFKDNVTNMLGGALQITGAEGRVEINDCLFTGNRAAGNGGSAINIALLASGVQVRLSHCTLTGNVWQPEAKRQRKSDSLPENSGAALHIHAGTVSLDRCVIAGNLAPAAEADKRDVYGAFEQTGPNFIGGDPKHAPAGLGASVK